MNTHAAKTVDGFYWVTRTEGDRPEVALRWWLQWHFAGDDNAADTVAAIHGERLQEPMVNTASGDGRTRATTRP